ncbi:putative polyamine oxidase 5 [Capsicum annuum]|uniref:Polyamine oxidase 5 n=1 Tax=Capsicum annuum TaxID=4072 RepID=A0A2G2YV75_CAPAN|nr:putative polyamine oxidase 5 [Capsicum annuum]
MLSQKPKIVIIGAGIAGLAAAKKLYTTQNFNELFELCVVEGGNRIGGRIFTNEFCGDKVEMGASWIHGIDGNPIYKIAKDINAFENDEPWDPLGGKMENKMVITEDGHEVNSSIVNNISSFFKNLLDFASGEGDFGGGIGGKIVERLRIENGGGIEKVSIGAFLRKGLEFYWGLRKDQENVESFNLDDGGSEKDHENGEIFNLDNGGSEKDQEHVKSFNLDDGGSEKDHENDESFNLDDGGSEKDHENVESFNLNDGGSEKIQENVESFNLDDGGSEKDHENDESFNLDDGGSEKDHENDESFNLDYGGSEKDQENVEVFENWSRKSLEEGVFAMFENIHRHYSSAGDLGTLDFNGHSEYIDFPGDDITIAKGFSSVIESLGSVLPSGLIQLGRKVTKIEWQLENNDGNKPVKLHFSDGSVMYADHVIVTISLGVLKQGIREDSSLFSPPLPSFKTDAISRLGFGVVDKLFLQLSPTHHENVGYDGMKFPNMMMVFHQPDAKLNNPKIPFWIRRTTLVHPVYPESRVVMLFFAGEEALKVESLDDEEIIEGVSTTMSEIIANAKHFKNLNAAAESESFIKFTKVLKCKWGTDPLFLGSYTHIAVGSSGDDLDSMAEPLPEKSGDGRKSTSCHQLQVLFAGEATSRAHYSTTHGAYLTGLREANRLLEHYQCVDV